MVTFRCKRSGNTVSFTNEDDIRGLRAHEGYEEIKDEKVPDEGQKEPDADAQKEDAQQKDVLKKKRGRPRK